MASNGTHLFIAGDDANGNVILLERPAGGAVFTSTVIQRGEGIHSNFMRVAAAPNLPPSLAWIRLTVTLQEPNGEPHLHAAHQREGTWVVEEVRTRNTPGLDDFVSTAAADYLSGDGFWRRNEAGWIQCDLGDDFGPIDHALVANGTQALLVYVAIGPVERLVAVALDPTTPTCLPEGVGPLQWHP